MKDHELRRALNFDKKYTGTRIPRKIVSLKDQIDTNNNHRKSHDKKLEEKIYAIAKHLGIQFKYTHEVPAVESRLITVKKK